MSKLETIETLVQKIPCPVCLNSRLQINLSCDLPKSPCDYHAVCGHCNFKFVVTEDWKDQKDLLHVVRNHVERNGCPECHSKDLQIDFLCDLGSEDCFFLVRCEGSNHYSRVDQNGIRYLFS